jgi:hypothetical protein
VTAGAAPHGSIVGRESPRPDLLAFEIRGKIPEADIEWMASVVDQAMKAHDEIDMILIMTNYQGSELGAIFDGEAMSVQARSVAHVRKYAVVGAPAWARAMIGLFGSISPVEAKTFDLADEARAWTWVGGAAA